jgi:hypothetical protein
VSSLDKRLERVEKALDPLETFLVWLDEAHEHPSLQAYLATLEHQPDVALPLPRLLTQVESGARAATGSGPSGCRRR